MSANEIIASLPFIEHVGLTPGPAGSLQLPFDPRLLNHLGTCHAGALFTLGEATSGAALFDALGEHLEGVTPVVRSARIDYLKPGLTALAAVGSVDAQGALDRLAADGKTDLDVKVDVTDEAGVVVARLVGTWALRKPRQ